MKILPLPVALPGKCTICGASDNTDGREYIDFGFEIDYYGVVYFCSHCLSEIAMAIGYISPSAHKSLEADITDLAEDRLKLGAENVKLRVALNNLDFLGSTGINGYDDVDPKDSVESKGSDNTKSVEQVTKSGRTNVPKAGKPESTELDIDNFDV